MTTIETTPRPQSQSEMFDLGAGEASLVRVNAVLSEKHYLGVAQGGVCWADELGVAVFSVTPTARNLPLHWIELSRWCLTGGKNAGSRQWSRMRRWLLGRFLLATTVVSYSDPSRNHTGALYRACGWLWAPTWHRIVTPPTGNGDWGSGPQAAKDRWVYCLRIDRERVAVLQLDESYTRRFPWAKYTEPAGANWKEHATRTAA